MQTTVNVECPECGAQDVSTLDLDYAGRSFFVVECEACSNPYVIEVEVSYKATPCIIRRK